MNTQLAGALALNVALAVGAGYTAKQWAQGGHGVGTLAVAITINAGAFIALCFAIRSAGLALGTAIALLLTITLNTTVGVVAFHESLNPLQIWGLVAASIAIALLVAR